MKQAIAACIVTALVVGAVSAGAASLITGHQIKNGTITNRDVHKRTISMNRLTNGVQRILKSAGGQSTGVSGPVGPAGPKGDTGAGGPQGPKGDKGADGLDSDAVRTITADHLGPFSLAPMGDNGDTSDNGTIAFGTPPVPGPLGDQALEMTSSNGKPVVVYAYKASSPTDPANPVIGELTHASYASLIHTQPQSALDASLQIEVIHSTAPHFANGYTTVVFEPYQNGSPDTLDQWNRHAVDRGKVWSTQALASGNCTQADPCPFSQFALENPNAIVQTVKLRIGQNSGDAWTGFEGWVDDFQLGFGPVVRYDFGG
jgi:hypothetical protein